MFVRRFFVGFCKVSIPQAVWIACNLNVIASTSAPTEFQYRKRYGLHAIANAVNIVREVLVSIPQAVWIACNSILSHGDKKFESFNTASGMDCMQSLDMLQAMNTGQFQYRKRYGLHAMSNLMLAIRDGAVSIPQAVWIACNFLFLKGSDQMNTVSIPQAVWIACNLDEWYPLLPTERVSIPQAVWIACNFRARLSQKQKLCFNTASGMDCMQFIFVSEGEIDHEFQYRKRYGLHAISVWYWKDNR